MKRCLALMVSLTIALSCVAPIGGIQALAENVSEFAELMNEAAAAEIFTAENLGEDEPEDAVEWEYRQFTFDNLTPEDDSDDILGMELTEYLGEQTDMCLPSFIEVDGENLPVLKLGDSLFENNKRINSVTLPANVRVIGERAFAGASSLVCIVTTESLMKIGASAFEGCEAFNSVILYDTVSEIGENAFADCTSIMIYCGLEGYAHTYAAENLIPFTLIDKDAEPEIHYVDEIEYYILNGEAILRKCPVEKEGEIEIPLFVKNYPVTKIDTSAFADCNLLTKILMPETVTDIGSHAFIRCRALTEITVPEGVSVIKDATFQECSSLALVELPEGITRIEGYAFYHCDILSTVKLPDALTFIGAWAFASTGLTEIIIPEKVETIGDSAFYWTRSMVTVGILNCNVKMMSTSFKDCTMWNLYVPRGLKYPSFDRTCVNAKNIYVEDIKAWAENSFVVDIGYYGSEPLKYNLYLNGELVVDLVIPENMTVVPQRAFRYCKSIETVTLHDKVTYVSGFSYCDNLREVIIPNGVEEIGEMAFSRCNALTSIHIPSSVKKIGRIAFGYSPNLKTVYFDDLESMLNIEYAEAEVDTTSSPLGIAENVYVNNVKISDIVVPESITEIRPLSLVGPWLKSVRLHDKVTKIGEYAFGNASNLTEITIPESVAEIGTRAFFGCSSLKEITIPSAVETINAYTFCGCSALETVNLQSGLKTIETNAFNGCAALAEIAIPETVTTLGGGAFSESGLTRVAISGNITTMEIGVFKDCKELKDVTFCDGIKQIGVEMFMNCSAIETISIPDTVETIGGSAFEYCTALKNISLPDSVTLIQSRAFCGCTGLENIVLPKNLSQLAYQLFVSCSGLKNVTIPEGIQSIPGMCFAGTGIESIVIPEGVSYIDIEAVMNCAKLAEVSMPESVTKIGYRAFYNCPGLLKLRIPASVTEIMDNDILVNKTTTLEVYANSYGHTYAQENGYDFELVGELALDNITYEFVDGKATVKSCVEWATGEIVIPDTVNGCPVTAIADRAFCECKYITDIKIPDTVETIGTSAFGGCSSIKELIIPQKVTAIGGSVAGSATALESVTIRGPIETIKYYSFSGCTSLKNITLPDTVRSIEKEAFRGCTKLNNINFPENLESIGERAFYHAGVSMAILPDSLTYIAEEAFSECGELTEVLIPRGVTTILKEAFYKCPKLEKVIINEGVVAIDVSAFAECAVLTDVSIGDSVTHISQNAFGKCYALKNVSFPRSLVYIGFGAFADCRSIETVSIQDALSIIDRGAFKNCYTLKTVELGKGLKSVERSAFENCYALEDITLSEGLETIGNTAFMNCSSAKKIVVPESVTSIGTDAFGGTTAAIIHVYRNSTAHKYAIDNSLTYFVIRKVINPEVDYGTEISGRVTYTDGSAVKGATVKLMYYNGEEKGEANTDENGAYTFDYAEVGKYTLKVSDEAGLTGTETVNVKRKNAFDVFLAGETDIVIKNSWSVFGTVTPAGETKISLIDDKNNIIAMADAQNGTFCIENVANGTYVIRAESESGSTVKEITVFGGDLEVALEIIAQNATISGLVKDEKGNIRSWADVSVYNAEGLVAASGKTDTEGMYVFEGLPLGSYSIVAQSNEITEHKKHGYKRSEVLVGYGYITITETIKYDVETIIVYGGKDSSGTIEGKVTAQGENQIAEVALADIFGNEIAIYKTAANGKYKFVNINDGCYVITAVTQSKGIGATTVLVLDGKVYGILDIYVSKASKHVAHEENMKNIPDCSSRNEALQYKDEIIAEKNFYDGLSKKDKKNLSREYTQKLSCLCQLISGAACSVSGDAVIDGAGMLVEVTELKNDTKVSLAVEVEKVDSYFLTPEGVETDEDYIQQSIEDAALGKTLGQYYDITLKKNSGNGYAVVDSISKDTETTGTLTITLPIPEAHKGHKNYSLIHVHNGEATVLTDVDTNPDTITFETAKFSKFVLAYSDADVTEEVPAGSVTYSEGKISVRSDVDAKLYIANYDETGRFVKAVGFDITAGADAEIFDFSVNQKAFLWDLQMVPVCRTFVLGN